MAESAGKQDIAREVSSGRCHAILDCISVDFLEMVGPHVWLTKVLNLLDLTDLWLRLDVS